MRSKVEYYSGNKITNKVLKRINLIDLISSLQKPPTNENQIEENNLN